MQGLGFAYGLEPWIERCYAGQEELAAQARLRHQEFFNTQPYMSTFVMGMVCALEEDVAAAAPEERPARVERLRTLKSAAASALAGVGDSLFWVTLRPACAALALAGALFFSLWSVRAGAAWTLVAYLGLYNGVTIPWRWTFLRLGYEWKEQIAARLKDWSGPRLMRRLRWVAMAAALAVFALLLWSASDGERLTGAVTVAVAWVLKTWRISAYKLYAAAVMAGIVAAWVGWL